MVAILELFLHVVPCIIFMFISQAEVRNHLFTSDAEQPEVLFCVPFTLLQHGSRQRTTWKRSKYKKLRGGKLRTQRV